MTSSPYLNRIIARVSPPLEPRRGTSSWRQIFNDLGTALPADYVEFIDTYGSCEFGDFLGIGDPREAEEQTYHQAWCDFGDQYRVLRDEFPESHPLTAWPDLGGFLGWGTDIDGNWYGWVTEGEPDRWPIAVWGRQRDDGIIGHMSMTEFLLGWLSSPPLFSGLPDLSDEDECDDGEPNHISCKPW